jgi:hypothetical protein
MVLRHDKQLLALPLKFVLELRHVFYEPVAQAFLNRHLKLVRAFAQGKRPLGVAEAFARAQAGVQLCFHVKKTLPIDAGYYHVMCYKSREESIQPHY